jgi:hypothetical protein
MWHIDEKTKLLSQRITMNDSTILVFTSRSIEQMQDQGGSQAWVLDPRRARGCGYLVCAWNPTGEYAKNTPDRQHREGFLIAPITSVDPTPEEPGRYIIRFSEFARISIPNAWPLRQRNPVTYTTLHDLGINLEELSFAAAEPQPAPLTAPVTATGAAPSPNGVATPLTFTAAKKGLATHYGVEPDAIEIVIRG